jgi:hypothetical protein
MFKVPKSPPRETAPAGSHDAICFQLVDLGTQIGPYRAKRQIYISWELPEELTSKGKPFVVGRFYNLVANAKGALKQDVESWFGRTIEEDEFCELDLAHELIGRTCTIGIVNEALADGKTKATITSIMLPRKGLPKTTQPMNDPMSFSLEEPLNRDAYAALPEWLRNIIARSTEYQQLVRGDHAGHGTLGDQVKEKLTPSRKPLQRPPSKEDEEALANDAIPW